MDDLLEQFLIEGSELVQLASDNLMALERDPADAARVDSAFRAVHSLKGAVALFDFAPMGAALHAAEDLLGAMRAGRVAAGRSEIDALLECVAASEAWIGAIAQNGTLPAVAAADGQRLGARLTALTGEAAPRAAAAPVDMGWVAPLRAHARASGTGAHILAQAVTAVQYVPAADCFFLGDDPLALARAIPDLLYLRIEPRAPWNRHGFDPFACNLRLTALSGAPAETVRQVFRLTAGQFVLAPAADAPGADPLPAEATREGAARSLRVDAARIDALASIVGELIVAKNGLAHLAARAAALDRGLGRALAASQAEIDRLSVTLHRAVMGVRMTRLERTFQRLPRVVRETAAALGRDLVFDTAGGELEADKSIVDGLFEPLMHVLRNAVDHGIESPAARQAAGKPAAGRIALAAARDGDQIVVTVSDDGAGIDTGRVRRIARARGLMTDAAIDALDDRQAAELVFMPGFSTADAVTEISGRGVGMDVVRSAVQGLGGQVALTSTAGLGSTIRFTLPQAALVTTVMTVRAGGEQFGVPIDMVAETTRVQADRILPVRGGEAFVLRDRTLPVLSLPALLGRGRAPRGADARMLVVALGDQRVAVEVEAFAERIDVLIRPMAGLLAGLRGVLGHALMGDGSVLLVLDLPELIG